MQLTRITSMKRKKFNTSPCPIARSLDVLGDWWKPLILRECLYGNTRFDDIQSWLGISRNILTRRLAELVEAGLLEKNAYQQNPKRYAYQLTDEGYDACQVLLALMPFGDRWFFEPGGHPIELRNRKTGQRVVPIVVDAATGEPVDSRDLVPCPGPGFKAPKAILEKRFEEYFAESQAPKES